MGLDGNADPVLRVLSVRRGRTDVAVELAETDRVDLSGFGAPSITVVVVEASDAVLTYRLPPALYTKLSKGPHSGDSLHTETSVITYISMGC